MNAAVPHNLSGAVQGRKHTSHLLPERDGCDLVRGVEAITHVVHVELVHVLPVADCRPSKGDMHIATNLVDHNLAIHPATNADVALLRRIQDLNIGQVFGKEGFLELLTGVATLVLCVRGVQTGQALIRLRHRVVLDCLALGIQMHLFKAPVDVHLVVARRVHSVDGDLVAPQMRESDVQPNGQLLVYPGVN
eukprot:CAMPEP_0171103372 /NCGR_PEP_ID=MMETSP0766_2-20121228/58882_1 /TAXON_ID=439317 /ORGANISM="Gambierdiscus australes, Strain CAWD 149" /LENGTH=191 /DNA_ID=CAMNT_0011563791 /DNA_START=352 /DNA_END=926 /DNA_ORIENTATION=-